MGFEVTPNAVTCDVEGCERTIKVGGTMSRHCAIDYVQTKGWQAEKGDRSSEVRCPEHSGDGEAATD